MLYYPGSEQQLFAFGINRFSHDVAQMNLAVIIHVLFIWLANVVHCPIYLYSLNQLDHLPRQVYIFALERYWLAVSFSIKIGN